MSVQPAQRRARRPAFLALVTALAVLPSCGGGSASPPVQSGPPKPGQLLAAPTKDNTYAVSDLLSLLSGSGDAARLMLLSTFLPVCSVTVYSLQYETVGGQGEATTASAALMVPGGLSPNCLGPRPVVLYAHGTAVEKSFDIAKLSSSIEGLLMASVFAANGYIVVAPDYAGYDTSTLPYHPYLVAGQQAADMTNALAAARSAFSSVGANADQKVFVTGYSQGGYVALATLRAMQAEGLPVTAAGPMSGPYALSALGDAVFMGEVNGSATVNFTMIVDAYQHSYGNVYANATDVFEPQYANGIETLFPATTTAGDLYAQGRLPQDALFSSTPPAPQYASITPATAPASLARVFALGFGASNLVTNTYRLNYLEDAQAHPDGGFPTVTSDQPPSSAGNGLRQDFARNDLRDFNPSVPVQLCGGDGDPEVFYFNTQLMQQYWAVHAPGRQVTVLDVDSSPTSGDPYADIKNGFAAAKAAVAALAVAHGATDGGQAAVLSDYHAGLVAPFCLYAVKEFFDQH